MTAGSYPDDGLGEVFLKLGKQGSTLAGVMDAFSMAISISLQYGVPLETYVSKFTNMKFEPAGLTDDPDMRMASRSWTTSSVAWRWTTCRSRSAPRWASTPPRASAQLETGSYEAAVEEVPEADPDSAASSVDAGRGRRRAGRACRDHDRVRRGRPGQGGAKGVHTSAELMEAITGTAVDSPLCFTCGTKMRPAGSCYVCEGCGSTSGCS